MASLISEREKLLILEINDKFQIARNIIANNEENSDEQFPFELNRSVSYFTGVKLSTVDDVLNNMKIHKTMKFSDWWLNKRVVKKSAPGNSYQHLLRNIIKDQYIKDLIIPNIKTLTKALKDNDVNVSSSTLIHDMKHYGFVWKRIPKLNKFYVVEKTDQVFKRMRYLYRIKQYKENNRPFIHVEFQLNQKFHSQVDKINILAAVAPKLGLVECQVNRTFHFDEFLNKIFVEVPQDVVFIIEPRHFGDEDQFVQTKVLTSNHSREDIKKSLDKYNIPYDPEAHRADLFALHQKYKTSFVSESQTFEQYMIQKLKTYGYEVLQRPPELEFKYFGFLHKELVNVVKDLPSTTRTQRQLHIITQHIKGIPQEKWLDEDKNFATKESEMYEEELKLEVILDNFIESVKNEGIIESANVEFEENVQDFEWADRIICDCKWNQNRCQWNAQLKTK